MSYGSRNLSLMLGNIKRNNQVRDIPVFTAEERREIKDHFDGVSECYIIYFDRIGFEKTKRSFLDINFKPL